MDIHSVKQIIEMLERRLNEAEDRYEAASNDRLADVRFGGVVELQQCVLEAKSILDQELYERDFRMQGEEV